MKRFLLGVVVAGLAAVSGTVAFAELPIRAATSGETVDLRVRGWFAGDAGDGLVGSNSPPRIISSDGGHIHDGGDIQLVQHSGAIPQSVEDSQTWVVVAPYLWAPAVKGTVGALGTKQNVDLTLSELIDLIPDLNGAFMGHVEVGKGPRGLIVDAMIMEVSPTERGPLGGKVTVESNTTILEFLGMYRVVDLGTSGDSAPPVRVDVLGGVRYYDVETGLTVKPLQGPTVAIEQAENWVDLVVGARGAVTLVQGLDAFLRADVGGFGIGTSSKLAWNLVTGVEYACAAWPGSSLLLGYKVLDIDESKYSGVQHFVFDVKLQGPFLALGFRF